MKLFLIRSVILFINIPMPGIQFTKGLCDRIAYGPGISKRQPEMFIIFLMRFLFMCAVFLCLCFWVMPMSLYGLDRKSTRLNSSH